jgi:hypothetical protein
MCGCGRLELPVQASQPAHLCGVPSRGVRADRLCPYTGDNATDLLDGFELRDEVQDGSVQARHRFDVGLGGVHRRTLAGRSSGRNHSYVMAGHPTVRRGCAPEGVGVRARTRPAHPGRGRVPCQTVNAAPFRATAGARLSATWSVP